MAKTRNQKAKPNKPAKLAPSKKRGKETDISDVRAQLDLLGLKIIQVTADGNCFFRALADQLEGDEDAHEKYRHMVVQFIKENREMFEPFVEDEVPFDEYCKSMQEDGTWAGNMELQAASLVTRSNICIHRHMEPRWYLRNFDNHGAPMIHLSYHDGQHYNSVRSKEDTCSGPARPIIIKGDGDISAKSNQPKADTMMSKQGGRRDTVFAESIKLVMAGTGCKDENKVEQVLKQVGGDVDAAIEVLVAEQRCLEQAVSDHEVHHSERISNDECQDENPSNSEDKCKEDVAGTEKKRIYNESSKQRDEKKISRNKACPCGSKKKYKSCCGTVAGRSARVPIIQTVDYGKSRKERKLGRKVGSTIESSIQSDAGAPDMGALCI